METVVAIARESHQEQDVVYSINNGFTPIEALVMYDIFPKSAGTVRQLLDDREVLSELTAGYLSRLLKIHAIQNPLYCHKLLNSIPRQELFSTKKRQENFEEQEKNRLIESLVQEIRRLEMQKDTLEKDLLALSQKSGESNLPKVFRSWVTSNGVDHILKDPELQDMGLWNSWHWERTLTSPEFRKKLEKILEDKIDTYKDWLREHKRENRKEFCCDFNREVSEDYASLFIEACMDAKNAEEASEKTRHLKDAESILKKLYGENALQVMFNYLIGRDKDVLYDLAQELKKDSRVNVIIRANGRQDTARGTWYSQIIRKKGNIGNYLVYLEKDGKKLLLKFPRKHCLVYYLAYLADHKEREHGEQGIDFELEDNKNAIFALYQEVYTIEESAFETFYQTLLFSKAKGKDVFSAPRKQIVCDLRKTVKSAFKGLGEENYNPYVMTAGMHLTVSRDRIIFEGKAQELLGRVIFR